MIMRVLYFNGMIASTILALMSFEKVGMTDHTMIFILYGSVFACLLKIRELQERLDKMK